MRKNKLLDPKIVEQIKEPRRLSDIAFEAIHNAVFSGRIEPGEWLRQEALAQELGVSQVTVREALNRLVAEGLAVRVPYKGVRAVSLSIDELEDIYEMRALLEGFAFELAVGRISAEELAHMRELLPHSVVTADPASIEAAREANQEFHWIAIRASGRKHLIRVLGQLWNLLDPYLIYSRFWSDLGMAEKRMQVAQSDLVNHTRLLEALESGDGNRAREITIDVLHSALHTLRNEMDQRDLVPTELEE